MRITELLELRMRSTLLRIALIISKNFFQLISKNFLKIWSKIGQKTQFIPARPHHQNVKKLQNFS